MAALNHIVSVDRNNRQIKIAVPLTSTAGKTRVKMRDSFLEYGKPVATKQVCFSRNHYIEWQIGYDAVIVDEEKTANTTIKYKTFIGANGKEKYLYELSEYVQYFFDWDIITRQELLSIKEYLNDIDKDMLLDKHPDLSIKRCSPIEKSINGFNFNYMRVEHPLLLFSFGNMIVEIQIQEKQKAVGTQPMLYFCFPIIELANSKELLDRVAKSKEEGVFVLDESKKQLLLDMLKLFGILSENHKHDILKIINLIVGDQN